MDDKLFKPRWDWQTSAQGQQFQHKVYGKRKASRRSFNYHGPMMKKLGLALACLCLAAPLALAQAAPPTSAAPAAAPAAPSGLAEDKAAQESAPLSQLDSNLFYELLVGEMTAQEGEPAAGFALMLDAARKTRDAQLYQRAADIALQARAGDSALQAAQAWKQDLPASREANRYVLQILIALNRIADTLEPLKTELKMSPDAERTAVLTAVPRIYARATDHKLASTVTETALADYLAKPATASIAWTSVARMRLAAGDNAGALDAAKRGQAADARAEGPAVVALDLIDPKMPEAEALVQKYLANREGPSPALPEVRMAYARVLLDAQRYAEATAQLQIVTRDKPEYPEGWLVLGSMQLQDNRLAQAQASLERYIALAQKAPAQVEANPGLAQAYLLMSQLAEKRKDYAAAEVWLNKIENSSDLTQAQTRRASILASQGKIEEGRRLLRQLPERTPEEARLKLNAEVGLLREFKQYRQAHELLAKALVKTPGDADLLYEQSMVAEKLGSLEEMERLLRQVIKLKPDYHHAYNALGYSLADRNIRLPEARELIRKAIEFAPADPFIKDSLGWVEFRMGNKTEAAQIFEAAYKAKPDAEIAAHFGEVLWSLGQRDRAKAIWKEGQLINADNESLLQTLKRLKVKP
jgi:tetratricopeptide (TPR) repeat protein